MTTTDTHDMLPPGKHKQNKRLIVVPGFRKAGTTTLHNALSAHGDVQSTPMKESQFWGLSKEVAATHASWFMSLFNHHSPTDFMLDASTAIISNPDAPDLLRNHFSDVRIIVMIRDPARRAYSSYLHMKKKVPAVEHRSFSDIIARLKQIRSQDELLQTEADEIERAHANGDISGPYYDESFHRSLYQAPFETEFPDPYFAQKYLSESLYRRRIEPFEDRFPGQVKICLFEDLVRDYRNTMTEILEFTGLPVEPNAIIERHHNKTLLPRGGTARLGLRAYGELANNSSLKSLLASSGLLPWIRSLRSRLLLHSPPKMTHEDYCCCRELLAEEYTYWFQRLPRTKASWTWETSREQHDRNDTSNV